MHNFTDITMTQTDPSQTSAFESDTNTAQHRLQARLQWDSWLRFITVKYSHMLLQFLRLQIFETIEIQYYLVIIIYNSFKILYL